jgi:uncharacterized membrane protein YccC
LLLAAAAIWVGICTMGAARNRNFRTYGFLLSGYTASFIAIPALSNPDGVFLSALTRAAEISIGIVVAGIVSALLFPQNAGKKLRADIDTNFRRRLKYISTSLADVRSTPEDEIHALQSTIDAVGFEAYRGFAILEEPDTRAKSRRLSRLNSEAMIVSTHFHALMQLLRRIRARNQPSLIAAVDSLTRHVVPVFATDRTHLTTREAAVDLRDKIHIRILEFGALIAAERGSLSGDVENDLLDFETVAELLQQFAKELHAYCSTLVSLFHPTDEREKWPHGYMPKTSWLVACVSGVRATVILCMLSCFWVQTAWPSGGTMVLNAASIVALASLSGNPARTAWQLGAGTLIGALLGGAIYFGFYPHIDEFPSLCVVLAPCLFFGAFLETRRNVAMVGSGFCIFFSFLVGPDNVVQYDPTGFINDSIALLLSMAVPALAYATMLPTEGRWLHKALLRKLRAEVVAICTARRSIVRVNFESGARDLLFQLHSTTTRSDWRREALMCLLAVLEVGHACIDIQSCLVDLQRTGARSKLMRQLELVITTQSRLFDAHDRFSRAEAIAAIRRATAEVRTEMNRESLASLKLGQLNRTLTALHFLRSVMLDSSFPIGVIDDASKPALNYA